MNLNGDEGELGNLPERVEGWLNVLEVPASGDISLLLDKNYHLQWRPMYCVLRVSSQRLSHSRNEERGLQKKNHGPSVLKIGGTLEELMKSSETLMNKEDELEGKHERSNLNSISGVNSTLEDNSTNRFINFISRTSSQIKVNLKRTRSSTKLDRRKPDGTESTADVGSPPNNTTNTSAHTSFLKRTRSLSRLSKRFQNKWRGLQDRNDSPADKNEKSLRAAQSHESLVGHQPIINLTILNCHADIRVVHCQSILTKSNCFLVTTDKSSKYYSCHDPAQMSLWLLHLKRSLEPVRTNRFRTVRSVRVLICEAKNLSNKLRYFCELALDGQVYGRSTTKAKGEMLFWGEEFHFRNLQVLEKAEKLTINIFQDTEKKKKKDLSILIGCITLPMSELSTGCSQEKWFPLRLVNSKMTSSSSKESVASLRLKVKYQSLDILPLHQYSAVLQYLENNYTTVISCLEEVLNAKEKEELSLVLVNIFRVTHRAEKFLVDIVVTEVNKREKLQTLLRGNSIASKSIDAFMKLVSEKYLKEILGSFVASLTDPNINLEIDNVSSVHELQRRQEKLLKFCDSACSHIFASSQPHENTGTFPIELKQVFSMLRKKLTSEGQSDEVVDQVICSCFFLRLICPAILSPSLFGLTRILPQDKEARNCTLVAKAIQGLANFSRFGEGKEEAMIFLNAFVDLQTPKLKQFVENISTFSDGSNNSSAVNLAIEISLDLSRELSLLHIFLRDVLHNKGQQEPLKSCKMTAELLPILSNVSTAVIEQRNDLRFHVNSDSLDDLTVDEGTPGSRRTMRDIQESGSYVSFTSLQNISAQSHGNNGFHFPYSNRKFLASSTSTEVDPYHHFSTSSHVGKISQNSSSSCLDVRQSNFLIKSNDERSTMLIDPRILLDKNKSSSGVFVDDLPCSNRTSHNMSGNYKNMMDFNNSFEDPRRDSCRTGGPQRATLMYAAETEITRDDDGVMCWTPLSPQGNFISCSGSDKKEFQITFNLPGGNADRNSLAHLNVGSLKRPRKVNQQQPLIFSNPGFGMKSSLSQNSLKMDIHPSTRNCQSPDSRTLINSTSTSASHLQCDGQRVIKMGTNDLSPSADHGNNSGLLLNTSKVIVDCTSEHYKGGNILSGSQDSYAYSNRCSPIQPSRSLEFDPVIPQRPTQISLNSSIRSNTIPASDSSVRSSATNSPLSSRPVKPSCSLSVSTSDTSASFSGRGDIGFKVKTAPPNGSKISGVRTIPRKIEGDKDQDVISLKQQVAALKSSLADTKWRLQQEVQSRTRMDSDYERKLRISEQERKKMEVEAFEMKKRVDNLITQLREGQQHKNDLERKVAELTDALDKTQLQTKVNKMAKRWPDPITTNQM